MQPPARVIQGEVIQKVSEVSAGFDTIDNPELEELALKKLANVASRSSINVLSRYSKLAASLDVDTRRRKQIP